MGITRESQRVLITIGATLAESTEIDTEGFAGGSFQLPATSGTTQVTFYAQVGSEAYGIANDDDWQPLSSKPVTAGLPYPLPRCAHSYPRLKIVAAAGVATDNVPVFMKG